METTFFSASAAAALDVSVSTIVTWLPLNVIIKFSKAVDGKNELAAATNKAKTQTTGINQGAILPQVITFLTGLLACLAASFFSSFGAFL